MFTACISAPALGAEYVGDDLEGRTCVGNSKGYGPFDYTNPNHRQKHLKIVEEFHFTPRVKNLVKGQSGSIEDDLDYTLRAFPNHHQALYSLIKYSVDKARRNKSWPKGMPQPECYLQRAAAFAPKDANVELLHGLYLHRIGELDKALSHYQRGLRIQPNSAEGQYNTGLLLLDMGRPEEAVVHARQAYKLGHPLPGLNNKLIDAGYPP